ncbi:baculoviral IAP repeat-containing protein 7-B-like [Arctopsyche grandis]|uniref:baculoviral IAP repeat-containing protein 7-B-like n=1 Tax=Arctopsyche grandis TaxID=121162 RepID=UPI00406D9581
MDPANRRDRLKTLKLLNLNPKNKRNIAKSGFYYNIIIAKIVCFTCNLQLDIKELKKKNPGIIHTTRQPNCDFIKKPRCEGHTRIGVPVNPNYTTYEARYKSFENWPIPMTMSAEELAKNGFYYSGIADKAQCYHCDSIFKHWTEGDNPLQEHAKGYPNCDFLQVVKGEQFVTEVFNQYNNNQEEEEENYEEEEDYAENSEASGTSDVKCSICLENDLKIILVPCGHTTCETCSVQITDCPMCREPIMLRNLLQLQ